MKLTKSTRNPDAFTAEFDDGSTLGVTVAHIADFSLYTGCTLDDEAFASLKKAAEMSAAKKRALRILGTRNLSRKEMTDKLTAKGTPPETAEQTADWLEQIGMINDADYAGAIVRHYSARGYGVLRIRDELYRRGIDRDLWDDALTNMPDMDDKAYAALRAKLGGIKPDKKQLARATAALSRRGFAWGEVRAAVERYFAEEDFTDEE